MISFCYYRQPPASTITLHQKALFTFWMSAIFLWLVLQVIKLANYWAVKRGRKGGDYKKVDGDVENNSSLSSAKTPKGTLLICGCIFYDYTVKHSLENLSISNVSLSQTSLYLKHLYTTNISLSQTSFYHKHPSNSNWQHAHLTGTTSVFSHFSKAQF